MRNVFANVEKYNQIYIYLFIYDVLTTRPVLSIKSTANRFIKILPKL